MLTNLKIMQKVMLYSKIAAILQKNKKLRSSAIL